MAHSEIDVLLEESPELFNESAEYKKNHGEIVKLYHTAVKHYGDFSGITPNSILKAIELAGYPDLNNEYWKHLPTIPARPSKEPKDAELTFNGREYHQNLYYVLLNSARNKDAITWVLFLSNWEHAVKEIYLFALKFFVRDLEDFGFEVKFGVKRKHEIEKDAILN